MNDPLEFPLTVYRRVAAATAFLPILLFVLEPLAYLVLLQLAFLWHWGSIAWVDRRRGSWPAQRVATAFCLVEWSAAVAITAVEGWAIHLTPLMCLGPVVLAVQVVDRVRYRQLIVAAVVVIAAMTVLGRSTDRGPIQLAASPSTIDAVAIVVTPLLAGIVALLAWLNQGVMADRKDLLLRSRSRLYRADESARASFADFSDRMQSRIAAVRDRLIDPHTSTELTALTTDIQDVAAEIRTAAHGLGARSFDVSDRESLAGLVSTWPWHIEVRTTSIGERDPVVDSVARAVITDGFTIAPSPTSSTLTVTTESGMLRIEIEHATAESSAGRPKLDMKLGTLTSDRIDAIAGVVRAWDDEQTRIRLRVDLPLSQPAAHESSEPPRNLQADLRPGVILPVASVICAALVWAIALPEPEMLRVVVQLTLLFALPCVLAIRLAPTRPTLAIVLFVGSYWLTALVVVYQLNILKFFAAIALLVPLLMALPHVNRRTFTVLAIGTCLVIAVTIAIARLNTQLEVAQNASARVTDVVVMVMVPLCSAMVLQVSASNYQAMARASDALTGSRRRLVAAADAAQRRIERDLHDGTQQRLVSAALRTQIAARLDDPNKVADNVAAATVELERAGSSLAGLAAGGSNPDGVRAGVGPALRRLADTSPLPVRLRIGDEPDDLPDALRTTIWFCCTEALANAIKHAGELAEVDIEVRCGAAEVRFQVSDNGDGFPMGRWGQGFQNMSERAEQAGGTLAIRSQVGVGTAVAGRIPRHDVPRSGVLRRNVPWKIET